MFTRKAVICHCFNQFYSLEDRTKHYFLNSLPFSLSLVDTISPVGKGIENTLFAIFNKLPLEIFILMPFFFFLRKRGKY